MCHHIKNHAGKALQIYPQIHKLRVRNFQFLFVTYKLRNSWKTR